MAWIELHQTRARHPKTLKLATLLNKDRRYACGLLDDLWSWALDAADRHGRLVGLTREEIAVAMDFAPSKGEWLVGALISSGYMDVDETGAFRIHDWETYSGRLSDRREKDAERKRVSRQTIGRQEPDNPQNETGQSAGRPQDVRGKSCATVPIPYLTNSYGDDGDDARAREGQPSPPEPVPPDPYDPSPKTPEEAATRQVLLEFIPCGLGQPSERILNEIDDMVLLPDYGRDPPSRAALIIRAMHEVASAPEARRSWGTVKGLIRHWQKNGERSEKRHDPRQPDIPPDWRPTRDGTYIDGAGVERTRGGQRVANLDAWGTGDVSAGTG